MAVALYLIGAFSVWFLLGLAVVTNDGLPVRWSLWRSIAIAATWPVSIPALAAVAWL